ncbi:hypothetical protein CAOG_010021 [Capsaspora owczarzaki ATCC 30864]|uniref:Uncharacterized protein n=1 Tax=Capsaspora owczarzaki (strain ATCC 30864) TaxID=595528 RepID=A0A0D2X4Q3_CAPO3|nr:hypothetical protein CAOG_010021 [Capsaspora owczarzaki ATCC 30864]
MNPLFCCLPRHASHAAGRVHTTTLERLVSRRPASMCAFSGCVVLCVCVCVIQRQATERIPFRFCGFFFCFVFLFFGAFFCNLASKQTLIHSLFFLSLLYCLVLLNHAPFVVRGVCRTTQQCKTHSGCASCRTG